MPKKSIFLLLLLIMISGCVERGQKLNPQAIVKNKQTISASTDLNQTEVKPLYVIRLNAKETEIDATQNSIAGTLLLVIGIIIFL